MKPISLRMQAFGPFSAVHTIDFTRLGENPLFLIHGQTGAGKSSILDAICFALYGQTADDVRKTENVRCDRADLKLECQVDYEFAIAQKRYRISRKPKQILPGRKSELSAKATLIEILADGTEIMLEARRVGETNAHIERITGLQVEQFRQVMVLPQGKFRELLLAKSDAREDILANLFQTHIYKKIEDELKERAAQITREKAKQDEQIKGVLRAANLPSEAELYARIEQEEPRLQQFERQWDVAQNTLKQSERVLGQAQDVTKQFAQLKNIKQQVQDLEKEHVLRQMQERQLTQHQRAQGIHPYLVEFVRAQDEQEHTDQLIIASKKHIEQLSTLEQQAQLNFAQAQQERQAKAQLEVQLERLQSLGDQFSKIETLTLEIKTMIVDLTERSQYAKTLDGLYQEQFDEQKKARQAEQNSWLIENEIVTQKAQLESIKEQGIKAKALSHLEKEIQTLVGQTQDQETKVRWRQKQFDTLKQQRLSLELSWHQGQAASLAKQLQQDEPCPVCGSLEHPKLALSDERILVERQAVYDALEREEIAAKHYQDEREIWQKRLTQLEAKQGNLVQLRQASPGLAALEVLTQNYKTLQSLIKKNEETLIEERVFVQRLPQITQNLAQLELNQKEVKEQMKELELKHALAQERLQQLRQALPTEIQTQGQLSQGIKEHIEKIQALQAQFEQAEKALKTVQEQLLSSRTQLSERTTQLRSGEEIIQNKSHELAGLLEKAGFSDKQVCQQALLPMAQFEQISKELEAYKNLEVQLRTQEAFLQSQLSEQVVPDLEVLQRSFNQAHHVFQRMDAQWQNQRFVLRELKNASKALEQIKLRQQSLEQQYQVLGSLSEVANGRNANNITLQRFVLSVILDEVLENANLRLHYLSAGRYNLVRSQTVKGRTKAGLDIDVFDVYSGSTRHASTMSGGESFLASLALALGLSDVVQQRSGGIKLDTLFVDEGFGSLDPSALELAITSLLDLRNSGRMIGIISHVNELKEQISLGLEVKSTPAGSYIVTHGVS